MTTSDPFSGSSSSTDENYKFDSPPSTDLSSSTNENSDYSHPSTDSSSTAANENSNKGSPFRDFSLSTNDGSSKSVPSLSSHSSDSSPPPPGPSNTITVPLLTPLRFDSPPVRPVTSSSPPTSPPLSVATSPQSPALLSGKSNKVKPSPVLSSPSISSPNSSHLLTSPPQLDVDSSQPSVPSQTVSPPGYNPTETSSSIARPSGVTNRVPLSSSASRSNEPSSKSRGDSGTGSILGVTFAGVVVIAFVIMVFLISRKRRKIKSYMDYHRHPDGIVSVTSGGYYYGQKSAMHPTHSDSYHSMTPPMSYGLNSSYGNYGGYGFQSSSTEPSSLGNSKSWFTYEELMNITNGFSDQNLLGEGGFGCVYKGQLPEGKLVAVKQLKSGSGQGEREFKAEVEIISRVHHRNLVSLVGYCIADHHRLLVYEFVPNNTLEHHLHGKGLPVMEWSKRITIAIGAARGLAYLHEDCHPRIIHRDIKSANILLDNSFEAQVADFGLAKLSNDTNTHVSTRVMGTFGYMAPEYASSGKLTDRSDVFSFGVVLLELLTGLRAIDSDQRLGDESLVEWARPLLIHALETGDYKELVDPRLENNYVESEMMRVIETAAACVRHSAPKRPRMIQVARSLDCEEEVSDLTSGIKLGQSAIFEANQRQTEMERFRQLALGTSEFPIKD